MNTFRIWTDKFVHIEGSKYRGQSFIVKAETIEEAISQVRPKFAEGAKLMAWTNLTTGASSADAT